MTEPIFLKNNNGNLVPLTESLYDKEEDLQIMLAIHPELIYSVGDQNSPLLLIAREAGVPGEEGESDTFSIDHIFADKTARPTFIEVKRSTDTRIRREVIGQMFDYAAHARAYWTVDKIQSMFNVTCAKKGEDPEVVFQDFIEDEKSSDQFWKEFIYNLKGGNIRLIFAADTIPKRLQLVVEFLQDYMDPCDVRALEVRQFLGENQLQVIAPHYVGGSVQSDMRRGATDAISTQRKVEYQKFWNELIEKTKSLISTSFPNPPTGRYCQIATGISGIHFEWLYHRYPNGPLGVELHFEMDSKEQNIAAIRQFTKYRPFLEDKTDENVQYLENWGARSSRIYIENNNCENREELIKWASEKMKIFYEILKPEIDNYQSEPHN